MRAQGLQSTVEVYGLFAPLLPQHAHALLDAEVPRKRQGLVPDFMVRCRRRDDGGIHALLLELKTLHHGSSTYPASDIRCNAVSRRAASVHGEYLRKARWLDQRFLGAGPERQGPVEIKLRSFGEVKALVFGGWGEASEGVKWLLDAAVRNGTATRNAHTCESRDETAARVKSWIRRRWGIAAMQANARLLLDRLAAIGPGAMAAASRRSRGNARYANYTPTVWPAARILR